MIDHYAARRAVLHSADPAISVGLRLDVFEELAAAGEFAQRSDVFCEYLAAIPDDELDDHLDGFLEVVEPDDVREAKVVCHLLSGYEQPHASVLSHPQTTAALAPLFRPSPRVGSTPRCDPRVFLENIRTGGDPAITPRDRVRAERLAARWTRPSQCDCFPGDEGRATREEFRAWLTDTCRRRPHPDDAMLAGEVKSCLRDTRARDGYRVGRVVERWRTIADAGRAPVALFHELEASIGPYETTFR
jgi:hypothetical protein